MFRVRDRMELYPSMTWQLGRYRDLGLRGKVGILHNTSVTQSSTFRISSR